MRRPRKRSARRQREHQPSALKRACPFASWYPHGNYRSKLSPPEFEKVPGLTPQTRCARRVLRPQGRLAVERGPYSMRRPRMVTVRPAMTDADREKSHGLRSWLTKKPFGASTTCCRSRCAAIASDWVKCSGRKYVIPEYGPERAAACPNIRPCLLQLNVFTMGLGMRFPKGGEQSREE
jgi:hypothetical protein